MSKKTAIQIMFLILGALLILHLLIFAELIPYDKVWAGRLKSVEEMRIFEAVSILINAFMLSILFLKYSQLQKGIENKVVNLLIWVFCAFWGLNTIGNLFAESMLELILGTAVTLVSCVLCFIIAKQEKRARDAG